MQTLKGSNESFVFNCGRATDEQVHDGIGPSMVTMVTMGGDLQGFTRVYNGGLQPGGDLQPGRLADRQWLQRLQWGVTFSQ
eukprot:633611-Pelagomonas_calceolata.AAC.5